MRVKEDSEKAGLKFNIKKIIIKVKTMAFGPITSWHIEGEKVEVTGFILFFSQFLSNVFFCPRIPSSIPHYSQPSYFISFLGCDSFPEFLGFLMTLAILSSTGPVEYPTVWVCQTFLHVCVCVIRQSLWIIETKIHRGKKPFSSYIKVI